MFQGNKLVLATFSRFFSDIFSKTSSNENLTLYLKGIKYEQLSLLMSFMYSGSIEIQESEVQAVLSAAQVLRLDGFIQDEINMADVTTQTNKVAKVSKNNRETEDHLDETSLQTTEDQTSEYFVNNETSWIKDGRSKTKSSEKKKLRDTSEKEENILNSPDIITTETSSIMSKPGRFFCLSCGASYASKGALLNHRRGQHEGRVFRCEQGGCDFVSTQAGNLKTHIVRRH